MKALAIVCARDEAIYMRPLIGGLIADGLDVVLIDHESSDETVAIASEFLGRGLLEIRTLPWTGVFSLIRQLEAKRAVIEASTHDWVVHVDADEWLSAPRSATRLVDAIALVDTLGYNCINFNEFVFVPGPGESHYAENHRELAHRYYHFAPEDYSLVRAWRRDAGLDNASSGGHALSGPARVYPLPFVMRHFMVLEEGRAIEKYSTRRFSAEEVARGWHVDKILTTRASVLFPPVDDPALRSVVTGAPEELDANDPQSSHYWVFGKHLDALVASHDGSR